MTGLHTDERIAILEVERGIRFETFRNLGEMLSATMYKFCAQGSGGVVELERLTKEVIAQVQKDWAPPIEPTADTFLTKSAFEQFIRDFRRPDIGEDADTLTEDDFVSELAEDGWPDYEKWLAIFVRLHEGGELTPREREQALAYYKTEDSADVPADMRL
jgi:hypothetical protein